MKIRLCVLFGGRSVEHEVSIITALQAINKIDKLKYDVVPVYIDKKGDWYTGNMLLDIEIYKDLDLLKRYAKEVVLYKRGEQFVLQNKKGLFKTVVDYVDLAFPIMHGTNGEDGTLQGYLETVGIPYAESSVYASVLGQDKIFQKQVLKENNVNVVKYKWFFDKEYLSDPEKMIESIKIDYPVIVKPATLGSSVGIGIAHNELELRECINDAIEYDEKVLVEEVIENLREVNISVLGNSENVSLSVIEEVGSKNELLTYEDKYVGGGKGGKLKGMASAKRKIPADLPETLEKSIRTQAKNAFRALNMNGVVRIDFLIDEKEDKAYVNEVNTIPGSLSFYLWEKTGKDYPELIDDIINLGIINYKNKQRKTTTFKSNILEGFNGFKGMKGLKK
ncbi:MAG: D-alanine--D-alanine ligase [Bacilli bacterium]|nr:D-alanine--D-alanine ligase [Bacilli bacterium]